MSPMSSPMSHISLPTLQMAVDPVASRGVLFSEMDEQQQVQAMQIALHDPLGWSLQSSASTVRHNQIFAHPAGPHIEAECVFVAIYLHLHHVATTVWQFDPDTQELTTRLFYKEKIRLLEIPADMRNSLAPDFQLAQFQALLLHNFSPEGRAPLYAAQQSLAGFILTQDPTAQGTAVIQPTPEGAKLLFNDTGFKPAHAFERTQGRRIYTLLLQQAGIGVHRMQITNFPFALSMMPRLSVELPTSAHARAAAIRAHTAWRVAHPAPTLSKLATSRSRRNA